MAAVCDALAAIAEIGEAWLVSQRVCEHRGLLPVSALVLYGIVATLRVDDNFGRTKAAHGGVFVAGSSSKGWWPADSVQP